VNLSNRLESDEAERDEYDVPLEPDLLASDPLKHTHSHLGEFA
jgi:hypothetical protein